MLNRIVCAAALLTIAAAAPSAAQDAVAQFYRGKQMEIIVGSSAGGGYDTYARLLSRHMGKHIPGNPGFVVQNMPGAGGNKAAGFVYGVAPQDGTVIGAVFPGAILEPLLGDKSKVQHDPSKLGYLGSANEDDYLCIARASSPIKSYKDVLSHQAIVGASGEGGTTRDLPVLEKNVIGAQFKVIAGYPGTREMFLAVDNGELDGLCGLGWSAIMAQRPQAVRDHSITLLAQESIKGLAEVTAMGVPLTTSFAKNAEDKQLLELVYSQAVFGRAEGAARGAAGGVRRGAERSRAARRGGQGQARSRLCRRAGLPGAGRQAFCDTGRHHRAREAGAGLQALTVACCLISSHDFAPHPRGFAAQIGRNDLISMRHRHEIRALTRPEGWRFV
jgi:hypothetical protein